ncbi:MULTISPECIES: MFS transporter [Pseudomonas]|uniref:Major facilitator superfamily MFS_1 n=1 Tax=Pseudomonas inefficax TaxID=2078786 RepID=A0AAQ1SUJ5_9PSED|nr:MFS transporter [Pseudomonas inefficax]SPO62084.1 Major facilitator superfamily MFS_1 [Pseudomonas inefficax]
MDTTPYTRSTSTDAALQKESRGGIVALIIGHCAGLMDITALPIWVGMVLVGSLALEPQKAGFLLTLFLGSVVLSSLYFAPRLTRINRRRIQPMAYALAGLAFAWMTQVGSNYGLLATTHVIAGLSVGCGLSIVHGTMGGTGNPHRTAAIAFTMLSLVSTLMLSILPPLVGRIGPNVFFYTMAGIMFIASLAGLLAFPQIDKVAKHESLAVSRLPARVWFAIAGVSLLMVTHSMILGFVERIGVSHGFSTAQITTVLVVSGLANLVFVTLSGPLGSRLSAGWVVVIGPLIQATAALTVAQLSIYATYIVGTSIFISVLTFTHVFAFGLIARMEPTGRVLAATPVMIMAGSAVGPLLGGMLAQHVDYASLGWAAVAFGLLAATSFGLATRGLR